MLTGRGLTAEKPSRPTAKLTRRDPAPTRKPGQTSKPGPSPVATPARVSLGAGDTWRRLRPPHFDPSPARAGCLSGEWRRMICTGRWPQNSRLQSRGLGLQLPFRVRGNDQTLTRERGNRAPAHRTTAEDLVAPHPYVWPEDGPTNSQCQASDHAGMPALLRTIRPTASV